MGCTCSTSKRELYLGCLVWHVESINVSSFFLGVLAAAGFFVLCKCCCPALLSNITRDCCSRFRNKQNGFNSQLSMTPMFSVPGAVPAQRQGLALPGSTVCLATPPETGEQGSINMYGKPEPFNISGSQKRPTIMFLQKDM